MSSRLIARSHDLRRLCDEGYEVEIRGSHLLVGHMPYASREGQVKYGTLVDSLTLRDESTGPPGDHTIMFTGESPCDVTGVPLNIVAGSGHQVLAEGVEVDLRFSSKPAPTGTYADYYDKVTTYASILGAPARGIDPRATAQTYRIIGEAEEDSPFCYRDSASSRAGITAITQKLKIGPIGIVGVGGTGGYILDLVAKTPVPEIHLFDGDIFLQHNAFRAPGASSIDELGEGLSKVAYLARVYRRMHRGVVPHEYYVNDTNVGELRPMTFVFIAMDAGPAKRVVIEALVEFGVPFVDVGVGVDVVDGALTGGVRSTTGVPGHVDHITRRIGFASADGPNEYDQNIQIAELNALNAALAVIKWKKTVGFYADLEHEHHSIYDIDGNCLTNEECG